MNRLLKKTHMLLPIALSFVEGCARPISRQRTKEYASAHRSSRALPLSSLSSLHKNVKTTRRFGFNDTKNGKLTNNSETYDY